MHDSLLNSEGHLDGGREPKSPPAQKLHYRQSTCKPTIPVMLKHNETHLI